MAGTAVAYNPNDPTQAAFLGQLSFGEVGSSGTPTTGFGGMSTAGDPTDAYGFPQWAGGFSAAGPTHAAGLFQFEPGTWDAVASEYNLNFQNPADQAAGAWYVAQDAYAKQTGGSLEAALQAGDYHSVQSAIAGIWPSVTGNATAPGGLAYDLSQGGHSLNLGATSSNGGSASGGSSSSSPGILGTIQSLFVRGGLIIIGGIVIVVALWYVLSEHTDVPSPTDVAKSGAKAAGAALELA